MRLFITRAFALALIALFLLTGPAAAQETAAPQKAATEWLVLIDAGRYAESWTAAASTFKQAVTRTSGRTP